jgi:hypothetical protein
MIQALAGGWKDDPDTLPWLKQLATSDNEGSVRQTAIYELARGWKDDPDVQSLLSDLQATEEQAAEE